MSEETTSEAPSIIPGAIRKAASSIDGTVIWLYGEPKIGKTTFASMLEGVWFLATEKGQKFVDTREPTIVENWRHFLEICNFIEEEKPTKFGDGGEIKVLCIDTLDLLFKMCQAKVCEDLGVTDPGELPHGKGWSKLSLEFERVMSEIARWPYTLLCISHSRQKEFKTKGRSVDRYEPNIGAAGFRWGQSAADLILYAHSNEVVQFDGEGNVTGEIQEQRALLCHPQSWAVAGGRMVGKAGLPDVIPLDFNEFIKYFPGSGGNKKGKK